jgi:hypothetical protein
MFSLQNLTREQRTNESQIIVEDEDGEVVKTYELPTAKGENSEAGPSTPGWAKLGGIWRR